MKAESGRSLLRLGLVAAVAGAAAAGGAGFWFSRQGDERKAGAGPGGREGAVLDQEIAFYGARAHRDPQGALDLARLAGLYLQRARATGNHEDLHRAESAARLSLANFRRRNDGAYLTLAASLAGQHRFTEALAVAETLCAAQPDVATYRAALGEIQLELGEYEKADSSFSGLAGVRADLGIAPRYARWLEVRGRNEEALSLLASARDEAARRSDLASEQVAWFHLRVGDLHARMGKWKEAKKSYEAGLEVRPEDHRLHAAMARLAAARHRWKESVEHARRAVDTGSTASAASATRDASAARAVASAARAVPDLGTLLLLAEAYSELGDMAKAEEAARAAGRRARDHDGASDRAWMSFLLDHGRRVGEVVTQLQEETRIRRDIYGHDLLAWGLYRQGDHAGARVAMAAALRTGVRDAQLLFHAGMIERALGADESARRYLRSALAINPYFHPRHVALAQAVLDSMESGGKSATAGDDPG